MTTSVDLAPRVAELVAERDLVPVVLPCIRIDPVPGRDLDRVRRAARGAEWIVVTSARAVTAVWPGGGMPDVAVVAVGSGTAAAVERAGGTVRVVGDAGGQALVEQVGDRMTGRRVVFPHARHAESTVERLRSAGAEVLAVPVYATVPVAPQRSPVDAALFGSPSAVVGWCTARPVTGMVVAAIGETTATAVRERGGTVDAMPARPGFGAAVDALRDALWERSTT